MRVETIMAMKKNERDNVKKKSCWEGSHGGSCYDNSKFWLKLLRMNHGHVTNYVCRHWFKEVRNAMKLWNYEKWDIDNYVFIPLE